MKVKKLKELLEDCNENDEVFMFFQTKDGNLTFTSEIDDVGKGGVFNKYGKLVTGTLLTKK